MRRLIIALAICAAGSAAAGAQLRTVAESPLPPSLAKTIDPVIDALWIRFNRRAAMSHVRFISQYWRIGGNPGYDASINRIHARLVASGFAATSRDRGSTAGHST